VFDGFAVRDFDTSGALIHGRVGGSGPPLLLLQTTDDAMKGFQ